VKQVLAYDSLTEAEFAAGLLRNRGITCEVRNEGLMIAAGPFLPLSPMLIRPEVWVFRDEDLPTAQEILSKHEASDEPKWTCSTCGQTSEATFDACWSCGASRA
jgi:hypothetical protein